MNSSKVLLKSQIIYINCSWKMPSEFFFSFDCSFTVPTNSIRDLPVLGTKEEEMNDLQSCFVNVENRPTQLVSRFDAQSNHVSKIILDITLSSIIVLMNLEVVVDVVVPVRSVIRNENPICSNMCTQMREIKLAL